MKIDEALPTFFAEAAELLRDMETDLLACAAGTATADDVDRCALVCASKECKRKGALRTLETLTRRASELELGVAVRVQTTRCQSECADGPNVKLLPEGRVLNGVRTTAEADEALERCATYAPE